MLGIPFGFLMQALAGDAVAEQVRGLLQADALNVILGVIITVIGVGALILAAIYRQPGSPLLAFGLFSALYGIRLLSRAPSVRLLFDQPPLVWMHLEWVINDVILIPAVAFFYQTVNRSWQRLIRWQVWFFAAYAVLAIGIDFASHSPGRAPDPGTFTLVVGPATLAYGLCCQRLSLRILDRPETRVLAIGTLIFILFVTNEHLVDAHMVPWQWQREPLGFLAFVCSLGYIAARRFFASQQQLLVIEREMAAAREIQSSILPHQVPAIAGLGIAVRYVPMAAVAGDFYDFLPVDDRRLGILAADTIGHGVPAALVASMIKVAFASQAAHASDPAMLLTQMNKIFCHQAEGQYITAGYLFLDLERRTAFYAGAGHPPLLLRRRATGTVEEYEENGLLLGFRPSATYSTAQLALEPGERLLMYTDGILEATNRAEEFFGGERLKKFLVQQASLARDEFADRLLRELAAWSGTNSGRNQEDDLTLLVIDIQA